MTKLSNMTVRRNLLSEADAEVKAEYTTMKVPNGKSHIVNATKDTSKKSKKIQQVEVPKSKQSRTQKKAKARGKAGMPQSKSASALAKKLPVPKNSSAKNQKSPNTPSYKSTRTPSQRPPMSAVKIKMNSEMGVGKNSIPSAASAGTVTAKMPHGAHVFGNDGNGKINRVPTVKPPKAKSLNATTRPKSKVAKANTPGTDKHKIAQIEVPSSAMPKPEDAPIKPSWEKSTKGHNVMESVQFVINGKTKARFGIISREVATKLVESYQNYGYEVELYRTNKSAWKQDRTLLKLIYEAVDARYNNAPKTARSTRKAAMNRFFRVSQSDYNNMYESTQDFVKTLREAFEIIMDKADLKYRQGLEVVEGLARVEVRDELIDLDMITQAHNTAMALRNFRNEIVESYGFNAHIKHVFIEGEKFTVEDIVDWTDSKN